MADFGRTFRRLAGGIEGAIGGGWRMARAAIGLRPPRQIVAYHGYGNAQRFILKARVMTEKHLPPPGKADTRWKNFRAMLRRYTTDEVPGAIVRASFDGVTLEGRTDDEGYFDAVLDLPSPPDPAPQWHQVDLELLNKKGRHQDFVRTLAQVMVPDAQAQFGVISDIDDTVIHTGATNFFRMARVVMLGNAHTRLAFKGVAAFYQALQRGAGDGIVNPVFYVTSSPWNIFDVICEVFRVHGIPAGPLFMKDYGFDETKFIKSSHGSHKLASIREIMALYPHLPFILIGDSGQKDPEIYRQIVHDYPERIRAIYIRDVTDRPGRREAVEALGREVAAAGTSLVLSPDTLGAARHAAEQGFITRDQLAHIAEERQADSSEPTVAERILHQQT